MCPAAEQIIVGKGDIEGVQLWLEGRGEETASFTGMIVSSKVLLPVRIPRTGRVRRRVSFGRLFSHPEDGGPDLMVPWIALWAPWPGQFLDHLGFSGPDVGVQPFLQAFPAALDELFMSEGGPLGGGEN